MAGLLDRIASTLGNAGSGISNILSAAGNAYAPPDMNLTRNQQMGLLGSRLGDMMVGPRGEMTNNTPAYLDNIRRENELARRRGVMDSPQIQGLLGNISDPALSALLQEQVASGDVAGGMQNLFNYNQAQEQRQSLLDAAAMSNIDPETMAILQGMPDAAGISQFLEDERDRDTEELKRRFDMGRAIRDDFVSETEDFRTQQEKFAQIATFAEAPSAAGDIALVFSYMTLLDPTSVVREGEYATAAQAGGTIDRATVGLYNRLIKGDVLTPSQRAGFAKAAKQLYENILTGYQETETAARQSAANFNLDFDRDVTSQSYARFTPEQLDAIGNLDESAFETPDLTDEERITIAKNMVDRQAGTAIQVQRALDEGDDLGLVNLQFADRQEAQEFLNTFYDNARLSYPNMSFDND
tara:strand:- start:5188 stop:6423 length:1236 start_codon:yes stop_codon:yes gene_type:complete